MSAGLAEAVASGLFVVVTGDAFRGGVVVSVGVFEPDVEDAVVFFGAVV